MKNILLTLILFMLIISSSYSQPSWHIITVDSDGDTGSDCSLALDSLNHPNIVYTRDYSSPESDDLKFAHYNGSVWEISIITNAQAAYDGSIALDSNDKAHISFYNYDVGNSYVKYVTNASGSWQFSDIESYGTVTTIAVDNLNHPHIAYDYKGIYGLKYAYFDGNDWIIQMVDSQQWSGAGQNNSITTDSQNNPHISYRQDGLGELRYQHFNGSSWILEYPDPGQGSYGHSTSICLDSLDRPRISHCNPLRYCSKETGTWQVQQINNPGYVQFTSLALDSNNNPHIAYRQTTNPDSLKMAYWDGTSWQIETVDPTPYTGLYCSLKLDNNDNPNIAYMLGLPNNDLMYAWYGEGSLGVTIPSFTAQPAQNDIKLCWQATNSGPATLAGFNLYRIDLSRDPEKKYVKLNQNLITGNSSYTFLDSRIESGINYQYRLWATYTDGSREEVGTTECSNSSIQPAAFSLIAVYPNPAKSLLTCRLSLSQPSEVNLSLYDISGRLVLAKRYALSNGEQDIVLGLGKLAKGVYTVQVEASGTVQSKRVVVMR